MEQTVQRRGRIIPAQRDTDTPQPGKKKHQRVAAYCRVSTDSEEQITSYEAQKAYYTQKIEENPDWELAGIFADKGLSGTSMKKRENFNKMIAACKRGKIDTILTKSLSRFARNTVDCLETVRMLKAHGIGVIFEKENINTLTESSEFLITLFSGFAQAESESLSSNIQLGIRMAMKEGKVNFHYRSMLGYQRGADGKPEIVPEDIPLDILYEDHDVILVNKPKGMVVHPAAGHYTGTLVNALMFHCKEDLSGINGVLRPGIVHRIDMDTTGIIIACKNDLAHNSIAAQLKEHSITRRYQAIVHGALKDDEGVIDEPIGRSPKDRKKMAVNYNNGKSAVTHYKVLTRFKDFTHIECRLETGRTHQIRVHMASIGHPLLGDAVYGPAKCPYKLQGQTLHAGILGFVHPRTGEYMEFSAPLPEYFEELLRKLPG